MSKKEYTLEKILQYRLDEDMTEYFRYMKKKYADNKEVVDFCDEVLADEKLKAAIKKYLEEQYKRALLAKTSTTVETDVEENKNICKEISEIIPEIMTIMRSIMRMVFIVMIVSGIVVGIVAGFSAIFYCVENGPLIAIFLLLLFMIIMSFINEWLDGKL